MHDLRKEASEGIYPGRIFKEERGEPGEGGVIMACGLGDNAQVGKKSIYTVNGAG